MFAQWMSKLNHYHVQRHLSWVEGELRQRPAPTPELELVRQQQLDHLRDYWQSGDFPHNVAYPLHTPCFVDTDGRRCAVAHLMLESGERETVQKVVEEANYAYIQQMDTPGLAEWVEKSGLTLEEVALIQPSYCPAYSDFQVGLAGWLYFATWGVMLLSFPLLLLEWIGLFFGKPWLERRVVWGVRIGAALAMISGVMALLVIVVQPNLYTLILGGSYGWNTPNCQVALQNLLETGEGGYRIVMNLSFGEVMVVLIGAVLYSLPYFIHKWRRNKLSARHSLMPYENQGS